MHTVKQVAALAGITPRTLHHYDAIGLLKPTLVGANGYRYYGDEALLRLQQILVYRELGLDLDHIGRLMSQPDFSVVQALRNHRRALEQRIGRLQRLVETVDRTLAAQEGGASMEEKELFEGLSDRDRAYAQEALTRWEPETVRESHRRYGRLTKEEKEAMQTEAEQLYRDWTALIGTDPRSPAVRAVAARWRKGIEFYWTPDPAALVELARTYVEDPRFRAYYDRFDPRLAGFILECARVPGEEA